MDRLAFADFPVSVNSPITTRVGETIHSFRQHAPVSGALENSSVENALPHFRWRTSPQNEERRANLRMRSIHKIKQVLKFHRFSDLKQLKTLAQKFGSAVKFRSTDHTIGDERITQNRGIVPATGLLERPQ